MPRTPRVFVEGGIYHVHNRFASGEAVFADPEAALEFIELLRFVKKRDGWTVFAWVLMSNHYHLAIRSRAVPISQGFHYLQGTFSRRFNRSRGRTGGLWQSRYQAKAIREQRYLDRVVLYIHLNPVAGGLAEHPTDHVFGGHREIANHWCQVRSSAVTTSQLRTWHPDIADIVAPLDTFSGQSFPNDFCRKRIAMRWIDRVCPMLQ